MKSFFRPEREVLIPADNVTLALGTRADNDFIKAFEDAFDRVIPLVQTAKNPGRIATSMFEGYVNARGLNSDFCIPESCFGSFFLCYHKRNGRKN